MDYGRERRDGLRLASRIERRCADDRSGNYGSAFVNYDQVFDSAIERLHAEGRYRVFIDILRNKGAYPNARCFAGHNGPKPITVRCSNDYLATGPASQR